MEYHLFDLFIFWKYEIIKKKYKSVIAETELHYSSLSVRNECKKMLEKYLKYHTCTNYKCYKSEIKDSIFLCINTCTIYECEKKMSPNNLFRITPLILQIFDPLFISVLTLG